MGSKSSRPKEICGGVCGAACIAAGGEACSACAACAVAFVQTLHPALRKVIRSRAFWENYDAATPAPYTAGVTVEPITESPTVGWNIY